MKYFILPVLLILFWITSIASWINHLYICFSDEKWGFLIAGALFFPVGIIHGFGAFLGWW